MITADTITDEQIRALLGDIRRHDDGTIQRREDMRACLAALATEIRVSKWTRETARARCAEILNARSP